MIDKRPPSPKKPAPPDGDDGALLAPPRSCPRFLSFRLSVLEVLVVIANLAVLLALLLPDGDHDFHHHFPPPPPPGPKANLGAIAGDYFRGTGRGFNVSLGLLADGRYSFVWSGCTRVRCRESGYVKDAGGRLILSPTNPAAEPLARVFLPIPWGACVYLVPPEQMRTFCDAIIEADEPRNEFPSDFFVKDATAKVAGVPTLPPQWRTYLDTHLVIGTIVETSETECRIDRGSADGVTAGERLLVQGVARFRKRPLRVISVAEHSCTAREVGLYNFEAPLEAGQKVVGRRRVQPATAIQEP